MGISLASLDARLVRLVILRQRCGLNSVCNQSRCRKISTIISHHVDGFACGSFGHSVGHCDCSSYIFRFFDFVFVALIYIFVFVVLCFPPPTPHCGSPPPSPTL